MFSNIKNPEPALLSTLNSAVSALEKTGGKVICSLSALPTWGPGRLFMRDDGKHPGGEIDKKLFTTEHPAWKKLAEKMASSGIGVDFFMAAPSGGYLDIATVGKCDLVRSPVFLCVAHANSRTQVMFHQLLAARLTITPTSSRLGTTPNCHLRSSILWNGRRDIKL